MSASLRQVCSQLGLGSTVSISRDVLGLSGQGLPSAVVSTRPTPVVSLNRFVQLLRERHFHVRIIIAGSDLLTVNDQDVIDYAAFRLRDICAANDIGIGLISHDLRTAINSSGHATVSTDGDLSATGHDLTADGDFVPVVFPANMNVTKVNPDGTVTVTLGRSPVGGPCSPRTRPDMNSLVVDIFGEETGRTFAHEVGHFLGIEHPTTPGNNLMAQTGAVTNPFFATVILDADRTTMRSHCTMRPALANV